MACYTAKRVCLLVEDDSEKRKALFSLLEEELPDNWLLLVPQSKDELESYLDRHLVDLLFLDWEFDEWEQTLWIDFASGFRQALRSTARVFCISAAEKPNVRLMARLIGRPVTHIGKRGGAVTGAAYRVLRPV